MGAGAADHTQRHGISECEIAGLAARNVHFAFAEVSAAMRNVRANALIVMGKLSCLL
jgi:hypothetical protein